MNVPDLARAAEPLEEEGFENRLVPANETVPHQQLFVALDAEGWNSGLQLELVFVPDLEDLTVLQFFVLLPIDISRAPVAALARFILMVNRYLPVAGFGLSEQDQWLYFRHLMPCPNRELDPATIVNTVWMIEYLISRFSHPIRALVDGSMNLDEARAELDRTVTQPYRPG